MATDRTGPSPSGSCAVGGCLSDVRTPDHTECPLHSACYADGVYRPEECSSCLAWVAELRSSPPECVRDCFAWGAIKRHLEALRGAVEGTPHPVLRAPEELTVWFPELLAEAAGPVLPSGSVDSRVGRLEAGMSRIEALLVSMSEDARGSKRPGSSGSRGPGSLPLAKCPRLESTPATRPR